MKGKADQNIYDQIYQFLFEIQHSQKNVDIRRNKQLGDFGDALFELGTQPAIYPVGAVMDEMTSLINSSSSVKMGNVDKLATGVFTSPSDIIRGVKRERQKKQNERMLALWASIGGNLDANGDGALLSMLANKFNISAQEATALGRFYREIKKEENKIVLDKAMWGKDFMPTKKDKEFPDFDVEILGSKYKKERAEKKENIVSKTKDTVIDSIFESEKLLNKELDKEELLNILYSPETVKKSETPKEQLPPENLETEEKKENTDKEKPQLTKAERLEKFFINKAVKGEHAKVYSNFLLKKNAPLWEKDEIDPKINYFDLSKDSLLKSMAFRIAMDRNRNPNITYNKLLAEIEKNERNLNTFIDNNQSTYGVKLQRVLLTKRFLENTKYFNQIFFSGDWEKFETKGLSFTQVVKRVEVVVGKDKNGKDIKESYIEHGDTVIGKLLGRAYYYHPRNFLNGIFNNGEIWLKLACGEDKRLNKRSLAYALYTLTPGRMISAGIKEITKPTNYIAAKIRNNILNPFFNKILSSTKFLLNKVLGIAGLGGWITSVILNSLNDKFEQLIIQIVQVFLISFLALLFAFFFSLEGINNYQYEQALLNKQNTITTGQAFLDSDWELKQK